MTQPTQLLYLFLALLGLVLSIMAIIVRGIKKEPKKASISFVEKNKGITTRIHFTNVSKEKEKEILKDIKFDLLQIENKIKTQFNKPDATNLKLPFEND